MTSIVRLGPGVGVGAAFAGGCWKGDGSSFGREFWTVMVLSTAAPSRRRKVGERRGKFKGGPLWRDRRGSKDPRDGSLGYFRETQLRGSTLAHAGSFGGECGGTAAVEVDSNWYFELPHFVSRGLKYTVYLLYLSRSPSGGTSAERQLWSALVNQRPSTPKVKPSNGRSNDAKRDQLVPLYPNMKGIRQ